MGVSRSICFETNSETIALASLCTWMKPRVGVDNFFGKPLKTGRDDAKLKESLFVNESYIEVDIGSDHVLCIRDMLSNTKMETLL